jgi:hypothetical protein
VEIVVITHRRDIEGGRKRERGEREGENRGERQRQKK